jgi:hypothetical protein
MTEIGLGLSNVYKETDTLKRVAGAVGRPYGETTVKLLFSNSKYNLINKIKLTKGKNS